MVVRPAVIAVTLAALVGLPACGTGEDAQVQKNRSTTNGVNADLQGGQLQIRNVYATPSTPGLTEVPEGGSLDLHFHVYNRSAESEQLVQLASPRATSTRLTSTRAGTPLTGPLTVEPGADVWIGGPEGPSAQLVSINVSRFTGTSVPVTFGFSGAGSVTLDVPIEESVSTTA